MIYPVKLELLFVSPTWLSDIPTAAGPAGISSTTNLSSRTYGQLTEWHKPAWAIFFIYSQEHGKQRRRLKYYIKHILLILNTTQHFLHEICHFDSCISPAHILPETRLQPFLWKLLHFSQEWISFKYLESLQLKIHL